MVERIEFCKFTSKPYLFLHTYKIKDFDRITDIVCNFEDPVYVELNFSLKENKIPCIKGNIKLNASLTCQNCLGEVNNKLNINFKTGFLQNEQEGGYLDSDYEKIIFHKKSISTIEFITDEILMSMPMFAKHSYKCYQYQNDDYIAKNPTKNPFAILKSIKN
jgi:uncharacterized protein